MATTEPYALTAEVPLRLATPRALREGLALLGLDWSPVPYEQAPPGQPGLYAWSTGHPDPMRGGVLYVGVGVGAGGVRGRLEGEVAAASVHAGHGHAQAMARTGASPVAGPVQLRRSADLNWLDDALAGWWGDGPGVVRRLLGDPALDPVATAEPIAIRLALHLGDTAPPVNSQHTSAWASYAPAEWAGYAAARRLATARGVSEGVEPLDLPAD